MMVILMIIFFFENELGNKKDLGVSMMCFGDEASNQLLSVQ